MTDDEINFLSKFDDAQEVGVACFLCFDKCSHGKAKVWLEAALERGYIEYADGKGRLTGVDQLRERMFQLNDAGRIAVGLPPLHKEQPKKKQAARSLFD